MFTFHVQVHHHGTDLVSVRQALQSVVAFEEAQSATLTAVAAKHETPLPEPVEPPVEPPVEG